MITSNREKKTKNYLKMLMKIISLMKGMMMMSKVSLSLNDFKGSFWLISFSSLVTSTFLLLILSSEKSLRSFLSLPSKQNSFWVYIVDVRDVAYFFSLHTVMIIRPEQRHYVCYVYLKGMLFPGNYTQTDQ